MESASPRSRVLKFGLFEVNLDAGELRKAGMRQKLTGQPFEVLKLLLEHPQEIVTREEMQRRIWSSGTFVDYDLALKKAINRIREVLGDSADNPRFIETVPRLGYRFICQVDRPERIRTNTEPGAYGSENETSASIDSLAVLPFINASGDPETEYLSEGITETIINNLSRLPKLRVVPRSTVFRYKAREVDPATLRSELGVRSVVTGRVIQRGENLVVSTELVDAATDSQLWGERYDRKLSEIFSVQEEIATHISEKLRPVSVLQDKKLLSKRHTESREAYQLYLRGRYHLNRRNPPGIKSAREYFERAIKVDPRYALAYAGLAEDYNLSAWYGILGSKEALEKDLEASLKAAAIDPELAETQAAVGFAKCCSRDWAGGETAFLNAIRSNPNYGLAFGWYGLSLSAMARCDEAVAAIRHAQEIDPLSLVFHHFAAWIYVQARRYQEAIDQCREALDMEPGFAMCQFWMGVALTEQHKYEEALMMLEMARKNLGTSFSISWLGNTYARSGHRDKAEELVKQLESPSAYFGPSFVVDAYNPAQIHAGLGNYAEALQFLERAFEERSIFVAMFLRCDSHFDVLRSDPRFANLLRRAGHDQLGL